MHFDGMSQKEIASWLSTSGGGQSGCTAINNQRHFPNSVWGAPVKDVALAVAHSSGATTAHMVNWLVQRTLAPPLTTIVGPLPQRREEMQALVRIVQHSGIPIVIFHVGYRTRDIALETTLGRIARTLSFSSGMTATLV